MLVPGLIWLVAMSLIPLVARGDYVEEYVDHFTNDFVVKIDGDPAVADFVANIHGFKNIQQLESLEDNLFHFVHEETEHRAKRSAVSVLERLNQDPNVLFVEQQVVLQREKKGLLDHARNMVYDKQTELMREEVDQDEILERYFGSEMKRTHQPCVNSEYARGFPDFNDQYSCLMWYLVNNGQTKGKRGYDINVLDAWEKYTGKGVVVTVLDDGLDHNHPEIRDNYDPKASYDLNDLTDKEHDPQPPTESSSTAHGTRCAGEIAGVANNGICGLGVAYEANIGGVRLLDGSVTDKLEAQALSFKRDYVHIYSSSWGPRDDGKTAEAPGTLTGRALKLGAEKGRNGLGNIYAWATGNGGANDDCNQDGYVSSIYTLSIGCINDRGLSTYFSEICPSTLAVIFTGGSHEPPGDSGYDKPDISIITADTGMAADGSPNCNLDFEGTSSAAPLAAGCFALVLQANMQLTWRDMQHLVVETARVPNPDEDGWLYNGAGYHVNHKFGFGAIDCSGMTAMAVMWKTVGEQQSCDIEANNEPMVVEGGSSGEQKLLVTEEMCIIERLEHVQVHIKYTTTYRGDMSIHIISPSGTDSEILSTRPLDSFSEDFEWTFMTTHNWNEMSQGNWTLYVQDQGPHSRRDSNEFTISEWSLTLYGTTGENPNEDIVKANKTIRSTQKEQNKACELPVNSLNEVMSEEEKEYNQLNDALEKGMPYSRETMIDMARKVLGLEDFKVFKRLMQEEEEEEERKIQDDPPPDRFPYAKPDTSQAGNHVLDDMRKRGHLYEGGVASDTHAQLGESRDQQVRGQGNNRNYGLSNDGYSANNYNVYARGKNYLEKEDKKVYLNNRELQEESDIQLTDEDIELTVKLLRELLNELNQ